MSVLTPMYSIPHRGVLGDRRRTFVWSGSVTDSVVGAFLTQNVSDALSSRAYMEVASKWPAPPAAGRGRERGREGARSGRCR